MAASCIGIELSGALPLTVLKRRGTEKLGPRYKPEGGGSGG
jgi:hypothetical protein